MQEIWRVTLARVMGLGDHAFGSPIDAKGRRRLSAPVGAVVALCVGIGCGGDVVRAQEIGVDATGVRHTSYESIPDDSPRWELDASPTLVIGEHDSGAAYQFSRIIEARLHRGGVLVGDGGSRELRLFDSAGRHVSSAGRSGSGPGEFRDLAWLGTVRGDSVVAWDLGLQRVTVFDPDLEIAGTRPLRLAVDQYVAVGGFDNGDLLVWPFGIIREPITSPGAVTGTSFFAAATPGDAATPDTIARVPGQPVHLEPSGVAIRVPFTSPPVYATSGSVAWIGSGSTGEITRYSQDGAVQLVVRLPLGREVSSAAVDRFRSTHLEGHEGAARRERAQQLDRIDFPTEFPAFDRIRTDGEGGLWVREYLLEGADSQEWIVLDEAGQIMATMAIPAGLRVTDITRDRVVGVWRDEWDVESVRVYGYGRY